jgi:hypothetical protein
MVRLNGVTAHMRVLILVAAGIGLLACSLPLAATPASTARGQSAAATLHDRPQRSTASGGAQDAAFGGAVVAFGDTILIGATAATLDDRAAHGAAYVFARPSAGVWSLRPD